MDNTIIQQGSFVSDGAPYTLVLRSDIDWIRVFNETEADATNINHGYEYYWQRGMTSGRGWVYYHPAADHTSAIDSIAAGAGFTLIDSSTYSIGAPVAITAGTNATQPVYSTGSTAGLLGTSGAGEIVRIYGGAHTNINGLDFTIDTVVTNTSFRLANALATAPGVINGTGFWRLVAPTLDIYKLFYPSNRVIANITQAANAVVTTLVDHDYTIGQKVRLSVPATCGMIQADKQLVTVLTTPSAGTFTCDLDSSAFTAFNFPLPAIVPFTPAEVVPVGEEPQYIAGKVPFEDGTINQGFIGIVMQAGLLSPAGSNNDVIYWQAGKSFNE